MTKASSQKYDLIDVNVDIASTQPLKTADVLLKISNKKKKQANKQAKVIIRKCCPTNTYLYLAYWQLDTRAVNCENAN